jgi:hypothetical protein
MSANPTALQLRLQTLIELGTSEASTIAFPLPIDLLRPLMPAASADVADPTQRQDGGARGRACRFGERVRPAIAAAGGPHREALLPLEHELLAD